MNTVQPIRDKVKVKEVADYLERWNPKYAIMFKMGVLTGLRVSDILALQVRDIALTIKLTEQKTSKSKVINISDSFYKTLKGYIKRENLGPDDYLIYSNQHTKQGKQKPISRQHAYRVLNKASIDCKVPDIGTHSMRKTFGYHHYKNNKDLALLQYIFNHSSSETTLRYIGIMQDKADASIVALEEDLFG